jgi:ammonia channel protein AmtB
MSRRTDVVALAGVAVAGIIAISSAEGRYEPFDAVSGIVLAILLISFYRMPRSITWRDALCEAAPVAAVGALLLCIMVAPIIDAAVAPLCADSSDIEATGVTVVVSSRLSWTWLIAYIPLWITFFGIALRPSTRSTRASPPDPAR